MTTIHRRQAKTWPSIRIALAAAIRTAFLPPSPPAEKATARQDQTGQAGTGDGAGNGRSRSGHLNAVNEARACLGRIGEVGQAYKVIHEKVDDVIWACKSRGPIHVHNAETALSDYKSAEKTTGVKCHYQIGHRAICKSLPIISYRLGAAGATGSI